MGIERPDVLFVISQEGLKKAEPFLKRMGSGQRVFILDTLPEIQTSAEVVRVDLKKLGSRVPKEGVALTVLSAYLKFEDVFPVDALVESAKLRGESKIAETQIQVIEKGEPVIFS